MRRSGKTILEWITVYSMGRYEGMYERGYVGYALMIDYFRITSENYY